MTTRQTKAVRGMHKYHFNVKIDQRDNNAGTKAVEDCKKILLNNGYKDLELSFAKKWYLLPYNLAKLSVFFLYYVLIIPPKSLFFIQYPLLGINRIFGFVVSIFKLKGCKFACIIHDLDSLRSPVDRSKIDSEMRSLSNYQAVVAHNPAMSNWLRQHGYKGFVTEIGLFDYLAASPLKPIDGSNSLVFAGNLSRGSFLQKVAALNLPLPINLYGPGYNSTIATTNPLMQWQGSFSTEQIVAELKGGFGLIWDGDSVTDIEGLMGNYQKFNTPHKTSLYLAAGLPVIVSKKAAIAGLVVDQKLGITIGSISDIPAAIAEITPGNYQRLQEQVIKVAANLRAGHYFTTALQRVENYFSNQA